MEIKLVIDDRIVNFCTRHLLERRRLALGLALCAVLPLAVLASDLPYHFSPNTPIRAAEVNANFEFVTDDVDMLDSDVQSLSSQISAVQGIVSPQMKVFTASGPFTVPTGIRSVIAEAIGGGGNGGDGATSLYQFGYQSPSYYYFSNCGGNGGWGGRVKGMVSVTPGVTYSVVVGGPGGTSSFGTISARGGSDGTDATAKTVADYGSSPAPSDPGVDGTSGASGTVSGGLPVVDSYGYGHGGVGGCGSTTGPAGPNGTGSTGYGGLVVIYY